MASVASNASGVLAPTWSRALRSVSATSTPHHAGTASGELVGTPQQPHGHAVLERRPGDRPPDVLDEIQTLARHERGARIDQRLDAVGAIRPPVAAVGVPAHQVPAPPVADQARGLHVAVALAAVVPAVTEPHAAGIAAGGGDRGQHAGIGQWLGNVQRQGDVVQRGRAATQPRRQPLVELGEQLARRGFDAGDGGGGCTQRHRERDRLGVVEHQRRQIGTGTQCVAAAAAGRCLHRVAEGAQAVDVAAQRARVHLQALGQLRAGPLATGLQQRGKAEQSGGRGNHGVARS